jgi:hypothetical protein
MSQDKLEVKELRLGNWIKFNGVEAVVDGITDVISHDELFYSSIKFCEPIPLSKEWFERIHKTLWVNFNHGKRNIIQHVTFRAIKLELTGDDRVAIYFNDELINFKESVHSLQNIFFELTNTELTFNN